MPWVSIGKMGVCVCENGVHTDQLDLLWFTVSLPYFLDQRLRLRNFGCLSSSEYLKILHWQMFCRYFTII